METQTQNGTVKATSCTFVKNWEKHGKKVPIYDVLFSDGTQGESFGVEIPKDTPMSDCTITDGQYGKKIEWNKKPSSNGSGKSFAPKNYKADFISFAMSYTKDLVVAGKVDMKSSKESKLPTMRDTFNTMHKLMIDKLNEVEGTENK